MGTNKPKSIRLGYVYFIHYEDLPGKYKIGFATNLYMRMNSYVVACPSKLIIDRTIHTMNKERLEKFFHNKFSDKHIKGEWYALTPDDIDYIKLFDEKLLKPEDY